MVALVFVKQTSDPLTGLVKKIDKQLTEAAGKIPGDVKRDVFVVFPDAPGLADRLRDLAKKYALQRVSLVIDAAPLYGVANEADVTVAIYDAVAAGRKKVQANFALRKGELDCTKRDAIAEALSKVLPK